jgi:hypothetical protein
MLTCVYHPIDSMRVVEEDEAERLTALGVWFDSPIKARNYRLKVEGEIKNESKVEEINTPQPKMKTKGKHNER